jgi:hypothetical protein
MKRKRFGAGVLSTALAVVIVMLMTAAIVGMSVQGIMTEMDNRHAEAQRWYHD